MRVRPTSPVHVDRPRPGCRHVVATAIVLAAGGMLIVPAMGAAAGPGGVAVAAAPGSGPFASVPLASLSDGLRTTSATVKKADCAALTRKAKRAKADQRKWLQQQARKCPADNKRLTQALKAIGNGRYVGARGDGQEVDWTICADGKYRLRSSGAYGNAVSSGTKWQVVWSRANGPKGFTAIVEDARPGGGRLSIGLSLRGAQWGVGIASFGNEVDKIGSVTRTDATADCATL